jgi:SAM-dependent methyltransferase
MPGLDTKLHVDMLEQWRRQRSLSQRVLRAIRLTKQALLGKEIYGLHWGDPELLESLRFLKDRFVLPYVNPDHDALEIGPGGGRWTRYLLGFRKLYVVDYYAEVLQQLRTTVKAPNITMIKNDGYNFPNVPGHSIDFLFSFGTFVHLELDLIRAYLENIREILKPSGNVVIHYSDKGKIVAQMNKTFSDNNPDKMRRIIANCGFKLMEEDLTTLSHSSVARFTLES